MIEVGLILSRWLHYAGVTALFGLSLFRLYAPQTAVAAGGRWRWLVSAALLALLSGIAWFYFAVASIAGSTADVAATLPTVLTATDFGPIWSARLLLALILCAPALARRRALHAALAGGLVASIAFTGHARIHEGALGWLHVGSDAVHLLAAGTWLGALTAFLLLLRQAPREVATARSLSEFSRVGIAAVATLTITGALNGWLILGGILPLFSGLYGRLLMVKVGLAIGMVAFAAHNRLRLVPALEVAGDETAVAHLRRSIVGEQALGIAVLLIVAALGALDPTGS